MCFFILFYHSYHSYRLILSCIPTIIKTLLSDEFSRHCVLSDRTQLTPRGVIDNREILHSTDWESNPQPSCLQSHVCAPAPRRRHIYDFTKCICCEKIKKIFSKLYNKKNFRNKSYYMSSWCTPWPASTRRGGCFSRARRRIRWIFKPFCIPFHIVLGTLRI